MALHEIPLERRTLHGHFSRDLEPVASIDPGDTIAISCPSSSWLVAPGERFEPYDEELDAGHALVGPVEVRGARAGKTLVVHIRRVVPGGFGNTLWHSPTRIDCPLQGRTAVEVAGRRVALEPFLGVLGMPPPEHGRHSTIPPRRWGGNMDCKELVAGASLYLPIPVDGALFSAGDRHGAHGDGEVSGTAIECPVERAELTLELSDLELRSPIGRVDGAWLAFGFHEDFDLAAEEATAAMLDLMERELGLERGEACALASVAVDLRVTQNVNGVKGVHAVLRDDALRLPGS